VGLVLSGGNIDPMLLGSIIERGLVRSGRLVRLRVELRDLPGTLAQVTSIISALQANIEEVHHQRAFTELPVQVAAVELVLQTRNAAHVQEILVALRAAGYASSIVPPA
jgi:threonine dehydratase